MAGIAALKAHLVKTSYNEWFQPRIVADILPEVHVGDSAVTTVTIESYTLFPSLRFSMRSYDQFKSISVTKNHVI